MQEQTTENCSADEAAIRDLFLNLLDDWGRADGSAYGSRFTGDADYVAFEGTHTRGRKEIASSHQELFDKWLKVTVLVGAVESVRLLGPDVALDFSAPLGAASSGRLEFVRGAANVVLRADSSMGDLFRTRLDGPPPEVQARDGAVTIRYPRTFYPLDRRKRTAEVTLDPAVPWRFEFRGGLFGLDANLSVLELGSFEVTGGASGVAVILPRPSGTVSVRASGAIGGETRLQTNDYDGATDRYDVEVTGGASKLSIDAR